MSRTLKEPIHIISLEKKAEDNNFIQKEIYDNQRECKLSCFSHVHLFVTLWTLWGLPGSSVHGILQARILEWAASPPPGDLPYPGIEPASLRSAALAGGLFTTSTTRETQYNQHHVSKPKVEIVPEGGWGWVK